MAHAIPTPPKLHIDEETGQCWFLDQPKGSVLWYAVFRGQSDAMEAFKAHVGGLSREALVAELARRSTPGQDKIKGSRLGAGATQVELSKATGIGQGQLSRIERMTTSASPETVERILSAIAKLAARLG